MMKRWLWLLLLPAFSYADLSSNETTITPGEFVVLTYNCPGAYSGTFDETIYISGTRTFLGPSNSVTTTVINELGMHDFTVRCWDLTSPEHIVFSVTINVTGSPDPGVVLPPMPILDCGSLCQVSWADVNAASYEAVVYTVSGVTLTETSRIDLGVSLTYNMATLTTGDYLVQIYANDALGNAKAAIYPFRITIP